MEEILLKTEISSLWVLNENLCPKNRQREEKELKIGIYVEKRNVGQ